MFGTACIVLVGVALACGSRDTAPSASPPLPSFADPKSFDAGRDPEAVAIDDLNADGRPDLEVANGAEYGSIGSVSILLNKGAGRFRTHVDYATVDLSPSVAIGDLNGDNKPDLAIANGVSDTVSVLPNRGDGSFHARGEYEAGDGAGSVAIGDLNGDTKLDLVTANAEASTVAVFLNKGDGSFQAKRDYQTAEAPGSVAIGDLNGDRNPDLATANHGLAGEGNTVSVLLGSGDGSFQAKRDYQTAEAPGSVAIGDLNGDRRPDLVAANGETVSVLVNEGDGSFRGRRDYAAAGSLAIGDLNGDGNPDLATASGTNATISVLANRGDGSFRPRRDYFLSDCTSSVAIGDLNGDGKPDLANTRNAPVEAIEGYVCVRLNTTRLRRAQKSSSK